MANEFKLSSISDDDLLRRLSEIVKKSRRVEVDVRLLHTNAELAFRQWGNFVRTGAGHV